MVRTDRTPEDIIGGDWDLVERHWQATRHAEPADFEGKAGAFSQGERQVVAGLLAACREHGYYPDPRGGDRLRFLRSVTTRIGDPGVRPYEDETGTAGPRWAGRLRLDVVMALLNREITREDADAYMALEPAVLRKVLRGRNPFCNQVVADEG